MNKIEQIFSVVYPILLLVFWINIFLYLYFLSWAEKVLRKAVKAKDKDYWIYHNKSRYEFFHCNMFNWFTYIKKYNEWIKNI